jgi:hypothetical protein
MDTNDMSRIYSLLKHGILKFRWLGGQETYHAWIVLGYLTLPFQLSTYAT